MNQSINWDKVQTYGNIEDSVEDSGGEIRCKVMFDTWLKQQTDKDKLLVLFLKEGYYWQDICNILDICDRTYRRNKSRLNKSLKKYLGG